MKKKNKETATVYNINWKASSSIIAIVLIVIGVISIVSTFIFFPQSNMQCSTERPILSPNIDFLIFGFGMLFLMTGIAILYAGRQRGKII